jgi:hypothetical protein
MSNVTCPHCGNESPDWLASSHTCVWLVWQDGDEARYARQYRGSNVEAVATSYAFCSGDSDRFLCDHPSAELRIFVQRRGSDEVTPVTIRGHWQPTYQAFTETPVSKPALAGSATAPTGSASGAPVKAP